MRNRDWEREQKLKEGEKRREGEGKEKARNLKNIKRKSKKN